MRVVAKATEGLTLILGLCEGGRAVGCDVEALTFEEATETNHKGHCPSCGKSLGAENLYCGGCGKATLKAQSYA